MSALKKNLSDTVAIALGHTPGDRALVVFDTQSGLARLLVEGYRAALPHATFLNFDTTTPDIVRATIEGLSPGDLVILVQSTSFRLNKFRFRLELFNRFLKVIEHPHLARMTQDEFATYVDALAYDPAYYRVVGPKIKTRIDAAQRIVVSCEDTELVYVSAFECAKLNIGDYTGMKNVGGQFPIGEVFTEPVDFSGVNGNVKLFAFGNADFHITVVETPITVTIQEGLIVDVINSTSEFDAVLEQIRTDEQLWVRELGFGMNRALTRHRFLRDIGSYERMCGVHLSLGEKHTVYAKPGFGKRSSKYHVDVFVDVTSVTIDAEVVFHDGTYTL